VFTPFASGTYEFASQASDVDPRIVLYNSVYDQIAYDDDSSGYPNFRLSYDLMQGETYYIRIHLGSSVSETAFTFTIIAPQGETFASAIPFEFNGGDESRINVSVPHTSSVYYTFTSELFDQIYVLSANSTSRVSIQVYYGEDFSNWGQCYAGVSQEILADAGVQYWVVFTNASAYEGSVDFTLNSSTIEVADGGTYQTDIVSAGRIRYFKITNNSSQDRTYIFYSSTYSTQYDTCAILYNAQGEQVANNDDGNGNLQYRISCTIGAGETYYLASKMLNDSNRGTFYTNIEYYTNY
jgi:hypothetical protein